MLTNVASKAQKKLASVHVHGEKSGDFYSVRADTEARFWKNPSGIFLKKTGFTEDRKKEGTCEYEIHVKWNELSEHPIVALTSVRCSEDSCANGHDNKTTKGLACFTGCRTQHLCANIVRSTCLNLCAALVACT